MKVMPFLVARRREIKATPKPKRKLYGTVEMQLRINFSEYQGTSKTERVEVLEITKNFARISHNGYTQWVNRTAITLLDTFEGVD